MSVKVNTTVQTASTVSVSAMTQARTKAIQVAKRLVIWDGKSSASAKEALRLLEDYAHLNTETAAWVKGKTQNQIKLFSAEWNRANQE